MMVKAPTLSVVIPCYNGHAFIGETIGSLHRQTFRDFEIIVVDDGSNDLETIRFLDALSEEITLFRQPNKGLPAARNAGIAVARGTYILPLDCDDWLAPDCLEKMIATLLRLPKPGVVFCHLNLVGEASGVLEKHYNFYEQLFFNQLPYSLMFAKDVWERVGRYDESMRRGYEDWEFNIRLGENEIFGTPVREPLFNYRVRQDGMLKGKSHKLHAQLWTEIQQRHPRLYGFRRLLGIWRQWRTRKSTYPKLFLLVWWILHRILPERLFTLLFARLQGMSHSARIEKSVSIR